MKLENVSGGGEIDVKRKDLRLRRYAINSRTVMCGQGMVTARKVVWFTFHFSLREKH